MHFKLGIAYMIFAILVFLNSDRRKPQALKYALRLHCSWFICMGTVGQLFCLHCSWLICMGTVGQLAVL